MKKYFLILLLVAGFVKINAQSNSEKQPYLVKSLAGEAIKNIKLETTGGNITVVGSSSDNRLEVFINPNNSRESSMSKEEIKKRLEEEYELDINVSNNKLTAKARSKHRDLDWKKALNISFKAYVTSNVSTDLSTSGGNITLKDLSGDQDFSTSGGNLNIDNLSGKIKGRTSGGNMKVMHSRDDINLSTSGGNIDADDLNGNIRLSTSGGSVSLNDLKGTIYAITSGGNVHGKEIKGELVATTSGGSIHLKSIAGSLETSTSGGNIDVTITEIGKFIKINNSAGNVDVEMPGNIGMDLKLYANQIKTDDLKNFSGNKNDDEITGKLNGGGTPVTINAGSGRINISFK
ncbi:MAG TPA: hypothetical protein VK498_07440 [Ferruginibacter sp.]|nr:hypothetical protein [Ferruginibacter sp.]